jgi:hypothetical protein
VGAARSRANGGSGTSGEELQTAPPCKSPSHCRKVSCEPNLASERLLTPAEGLSQLGRNTREYGHAIMYFFRPRPFSRKLLKNNTPGTRFLNACPKSAEMLNYNCNYNVIRKNRAFRHPYAHNLLGINNLTSKFQ